MKPFIALIATAVAALVLSSCTSPSTPGDGHADHEHGAESSTGGQQSTSAALPADVNAADVTFVTGMIPHHEQAVAMSAMVPSRSANPEVIKLAADISGGQGPEIATMKAFLVQWDVAAQGAAGHDDHDMGDMGGMPMQGMVDDTTMTRLESLTGPEFDKLWLTSMIGHHEGAIAMAETELADGANADAKTLARQIVTAQKAEIDQMKQMGA